MKKFIFSIVAVAVFSVFYPGLADAGMYGEVYIPNHEFVGFYDETGTYTVVAGIKNKDRKSTRLNSSHSQQSRMPSSA